MEEEEGMWKTEENLVGREHKKLRESSFNVKDSKEK